MYIYVPQKSRFTEEDFFTHKPCLYLSFIFLFHIRHDSDILLLVSTQLQSFTIVDRVDLETMKQRIFSNLFKAIVKMSSVHLCHRFVTYHT